MAGAYSGTYSGTYFGTYSVTPTLRFEMKLSPGVFVSMGDQGAFVATRVWAS